MPETSSYQAKRDEAIAKIELYQAEETLKMIEQVKLQESFGSIVPAHEYPRINPRSIGMTNRGYFQLSYLEGRMNGKYLPYYENEMDLLDIRSVSRYLSQFASTATGAVEALRNYTIHTGFKHKIESKKGFSAPKEIIDAAQNIIDEFLEENSWKGVIDREVHDRSREEGEVLLCLYPQEHGVTRAIIKEPEQLTEPAGKSELEEFLGISDIMNYWDFGVLTQYNGVLKAEDPKPVGYHFVEDSSGYDWDFIPESRVVHLKRNVSARAKRGIPDFYHIQLDMEEESKLRRNTAKGATVLAAIVGIREHAEGIGRDAVQSFQKAQAVASRQVMADNGATSSRNMADYTEPHVRDIPNGMKWQTGPMGTLSQPVYIEVIQMLLRAIGMRWNMPEYMISGDASNGNFSSTLVAESPFVKSRLADQECYGRFDKEVLYKVLYIAWQQGRIPGIDWDIFKKITTLQVEKPDIASRNETEQTDRFASLNEAGIMSKATWSAKEGLDPDVEEKNIEEESGKSNLSADEESARAAFDKEFGAQGNDEGDSTDGEPSADDLLNAAKLKSDLAESDDCGAGSGEGGGFGKGNTCWKRRNDITETKKFKSWFKGSKVVDGNGNPIVVYHGTPDAREIFNGKEFSSLTRGEEYYFTDDYKTADTYADDRRAFDYQNAEPYVIPVYLSIKNPMLVDAERKRWRETRKYVSRARELGYDGIIIKNSRDEYNNFEETGRISNVYVAFEKSQIKSAMTEPAKSRIDGKEIGGGPNSGDFSEESNNIFEHDFSACGANTGTGGKGFGPANTCGKLRGNKKPEGEPRRTGPAIMRMSEIKVDAPRFQYKFIGVNENGVTDQFKDSEFNPMLVGTLHVWEDEDGKVFIVNGHHRMELANRFGWDGDVSVYYLDADNANEARALGAIVNIGDGNGDELDFAKFAKDMGMNSEQAVDFLKSQGIGAGGKNESLIIGGSHLANLNDKLFTDVAYGRFDKDHGRIIGSHLVPNKSDNENEAIYALQDKVAHSILNRPRKIAVTNAQVDVLARNASEAPIVKTNKGGDYQPSLFDSEPEDTIIWTDKAIVQERVEKILKRKIRSFDAISSGREELFRDTGVGEVSAELARERKKENVSLLDTFKRELKYKGEFGIRLHDILNKYAKQHYEEKSTTKRKNIKNEAAEEILKFMTGEK